MYLLCVCLFIYEYIYFMAGVSQTMVHAILSVGKVHLKDPLLLVQKCNGILPGLQVKKKKKKYWHPVKLEKKLEKS